MATDYKVKTLQSNIKNYDDKDFLTNYSLFLGSVDTTNQALKMYDPLRNGRARIFFLRMPRFMEIAMPQHTKRIQHILEYGFTKIDGIDNIRLETETMTGGYVGKQIAMPTLSKDETNTINLGLYEFAGSPIREFLDMWIQGISDNETGFGTYLGLCDEKLAKERFNSEPLKYAQYNHTAEAIYLTTDPTGLSSGIEYCCMLTNMFPTESKRDHFNYSSGESNIVQTDIPFVCNKRESADINELGKMLLNRFGVLKSSLDFKTEYTQQDVNNKFKPYINAWAGSDDVDQSDATDRLEAVSAINR